MTEIALAVVLLVGAGLMMKSLLRLLQSNIGFNPENVLTMTVALPPAKYTDTNRQIAFYDQLKERVQSLPGVTGTGTVNILPLQGGNTTRFIVEGDPIPPPGTGNGSEHPHGQRNVFSNARHSDDCRTRV